MARRADEQRQHPRVEARLAMQLAEESLGQSLVTTESLNISRGGVYCESDEYLSPLSRVALTVVLPEFRGDAVSRVLRTEGIVVRSEALAPDTTSRALLDAFVTWRAAGGRAAAKKAAKKAPAKAAKKVAKKAPAKAAKKVAKKAVRRPAPKAAKRRPRGAR